MEQMTLFPLPYKYIIDASSIFSQKPDEPNRRRVFKGLWQKIDNYIEKQVIVTCSEIESEIKDEELVKWLHLQQCEVLPITDEVQQNVIKVVNEHPTLIDFTKCKSSGDAFLIATAMAYGLTVISEEAKSPKKIPGVCQAYGIQCVNITELCTLENWEF